MPTKILIVGAGAVGAFYASRLAKAPNTNVSVICRSNYKAVKANGFSVTSPQFGDYTFIPTNTFANPDEARRSQVAWDYIIVSTKALPDVSDDSEILEGLVGDKTAIVLVQNGIGVELPYAARFPSTTILSAVTIVSAAQTSPGCIKHNRWTRIHVGPYLPHLNISSSSAGSPGSTTNPSPNPADALATTRNHTLVAALQAGGITDAEAYDHAKLQLVRWHKIAINAAMNPSAVLSGGTPNAAMALDADLSAHLQGVMDEVFATAPRVLGVPRFPAEFASAAQILRSTRKNASGSKPSMLLDWEQGKRMELEVILGNPIRIARERGIEMPRLQSMYALLRLAQENREKEKERERERGGRL